MMSPVGVGFASHGPTGVVGLTITTSCPRATARRTSCSASALRAFVRADQLARAGSDTSRRRARRRRARRSPRPSSCARCAARRRRAPRRARRAFRRRSRAAPRRGRAATSCTSRRRGTRRRSRASRRRSAGANRSPRTRSTSSPSSDGASPRTSARTDHPRASRARTRFAPDEARGSGDERGRHVSSRAYAPAIVNGRLRTRSASQRSERFVSVDVDAGDDQRSHFRARDLHAAARDQHRVRLLQLAHRRDREEHGQHAEQPHAHRRRGQRFDVAQRALDVVVREVEQRREGAAVRGAHLRLQDRVVPAARRRQHVGGDVDRVLLLGVPRDVLEDVHRLQRFAERLAVFEQPRVRARCPPRASARATVGEQMTDGAGDVVAVLAKLVDASRCGCRARWRRTNSRMPRDHLDDPAPQDRARRRVERAVELQHLRRSPRRVRGSRRSRSAPRRTARNRPPAADRRTQARNASSSSALRSGESARSSSTVSAMRQRR